MGEIGHWTVIFMAKVIMEVFDANQANVVANVQQTHAVDFLHGHRITMALSVARVG
jgi:hypothetical protein